MKRRFGCQTQPRESVLQAAARKRGWRIVWQINRCIVKGRDGAAIALGTFRESRPATEQRILSLALNG